MTSRFKVLIFEGASASSRRESNTISSAILPLIPDDSNVTVLELSGIRKKDYSTAKEFVKKAVIEKTKIVIVGKSYGAALCKKIIDECIEFSSWKLNNVSFLAIDCHSNIFTKIANGTPIYNSRNNLVLSEKWREKNIWSCNVYQHNKGLKGAKGENFCINSDLTGKKVDHYSIIYHQCVKDLFRSCIGYNED